MQSSHYYNLLGFGIFHLNMLHNRALDLTRIVLKAIFANK
ncbi:hypothetical protein EVA_22655 [gut metagenome]|uniref:Uncharacterized protein n=1 Tax=gut metagenome TaxID=749906 RepID=J9BNS8_9ZZZZ